MEENKKKLEEKKGNKKKGDKKSSPKPQFNATWLYGIGIFGLLMYLVIGSSIGGTKEISQNEFIEEMFKAHDVDHIQVMYDNRVNVFLKEDAKMNEKYKHLKIDTVQKGLSKQASPDAFFNILAPEAFEKIIHTVEKDFAKEDKLDMRVVNQPSFLSSLMGYLPFIFMLGLLFFMMRRSVGGGMGGGQIFNIGKSKAKLFDKDGDSQQTFADVAGLDGAKEEVMEIVDFLKILINIQNSVERYQKEHCW